MKLLQRLKSCYGMRMDELRALEPHPAATLIVEENATIAGAGDRGHQQVCMQEPILILPKHRRMIADPIVKNKKKGLTRT